MIDLEAIRFWLKTQEDAAGDFGGTCEYDHNGADEHIVALIAEVDRLCRIVGKLNPCPNCKTYNLLKRDDVPALVVRPPNGIAYDPKTRARLYAMTEEHLEAGDLIVWTSSYVNEGFAILLAYGSPAGTIRRRRDGEIPTGVASREACSGEIIEVLEAVP